MARTRRSSAKASTTADSSAEKESDGKVADAHPAVESASDFELSEAERPVRRKKNQRKKKKKALKNIKGKKGLLKKALELPPEIFMTVLPAYSRRNSHELHNS